MRATVWCLVSALCALDMGCGQPMPPEAPAVPARASAESPPAAPSSATPNLPPGGKVQRIGVWQPPAGLEQVPIWPGAAPDMAGVSWPPESVLTADTPEALAARIRADVRKWSDLITTAGIKRQ